MMKLEQLKFRHPFFYVIFEAQDRKGNTRELSYSCFSEEEQNKTARKLAEHFNLEIEEMVEEAYASSLVGE